MSSSLNSNDVFGYIITFLIGLLLVLLAFIQSNAFNHNNDESNKKDISLMENNGDEVRSRDKEFHSNYNGGINNNDDNVIITMSRIENDKSNEKVNDNDDDVDNDNTKINVSSLRAIDDNDKYSMNNNNTTSNSFQNDNKNESGASETISDNNNWRCACENGFLPPGLLKSFGGMEAMVRMGTGQCYHKT